LNAYAADDNISLGHTATGTGIINVYGGTLNTREIVAGNAGVGAFNLSGGTATVTEKLIVGRDGDGTLTVTGGDLTVGTLQLDNRGGFNSVATLSAGAVHADAITIGTNGILVISDTVTLDTYTNMSFSANGKVIWDGDQTTAISDMVTAGTLGWSKATAAYDDARAYDQEFLSGGEYLRSSYNSGAGETEVWTVIPEPATLGMVSFIGLATLFVRRRLMM